MKSFIVTESGRLDKIISLEIGKSRNHIEDLIKEGLVSVNNQIIKKKSYKLDIDDKVGYKYKVATHNKEYKNIDFDIDILYEDDYLLVINKPSGIVVHPAPSVKEGTVVDWLISKNISLSTIAGKRRYGIVHRIDKETTGALIIAKTDEVHSHLAQQLKDKSMGRYYLSIINHPLKDDVIIDKPIGRNPTNRLKMDIISSGKSAKSSFIKLIANDNNIELIATKLFTGRTHQIRVHLKSIGRYVLGDRIYGDKRKYLGIERVFLHAYQIYFKHPILNKNIKVVAPIFDDMKQYFNRNFDKEILQEKINSNYIDRIFNN